MVEELTGETFFPEYGKTYRVVFGLKSVGLGVYTGSANGKHIVLMRAGSSGLVKYTFVLPFLQDHCVKDGTLVLPRNAVKTRRLGRESALADKILRDRKL